MKETIYKRSTTGKTLEWTIEVSSNKYRTISGYTDGVKTLSKWTVIQGKNIGRSNETTADEQAIKEAKALLQKKLDSGYVEDISFINDEKFFKPMLANKWEDYKDDIQYPIYSQPKLDGIRCIVKKDGMWTRNGKKIISAPHIIDSLEPLFKKNPDLIFDGELYCDKLANDFNKICSLVKKTKPTAQDLIECAEVIEYHIYDLPSHNGNFLSRINQLNVMEQLNRDFHNTKCKIVDTRVVYNEDQVTALYEEYIDQGYEGQMLRLSSKYENKRTKSLLKHKSFQDTEFTILDICEGEGNKTGMVGFMVFETDGGDRFKSNLKADWELSKEIWNNKKEYIGKSATIQYFNLTPDGIPRFPYVVKIAREDYE